MSDEPAVTPAQPDGNQGDQGGNPPATPPASDDGSQGTPPAAVDGGADGQGDQGGNPPNPDDGTPPGSQAAPENGYADFSVPEGVTIDNALLEKVTPVFKELGLSQEQAQKLVDFQSDQVQAMADSQVEAFNQMVGEWAEQSKNDSEFGGDKFDESIAVAKAAIEKFGTPELRELLETHGLGNHPEMIRFMMRVGKLTQEDQPGTSGGQPSEKKDRIELLYGEE